MFADDYYDSSDDSSSGSSLTESILGSVTQLGTTAILANSNPYATNVPYPGPSGAYGAGSYYGATPKSGGMSLFTVVLLVVAGAFAFTKLK